MHSLLFLILLSIFFSFCNKQDSVSLKPNHLEFDDIRCEDISDGIQVKNTSSQTLILLKANSPSISQNNNETKLAYFSFENEFQKNGSSNMEIPKRGIAFIYPGKTYKLELDPKYNFKKTEKFKISVGYWKVGNQLSGEQGFRLSPNLIRSQVVEELNVDCEGISKL
ncbi:hypothetical protein CH375_17255 [Leptospira ellisii]|uniref:Lipoprotein n=2 Tax=Leptospira ellisii TaxID=2023197 RepID=A0A2N0B3F2_9LEPT|nr:hypothetical protein CH379_20735 [Leptospira ellisii]PKA03398.1 hypothetical protein CH375_17255 [Leptospira ellisii]